MSVPTDDAPPSLRKPSQAYVDSYIARRGEAAAARTPGPVTPSGTTEMSTQPPKGRHAPRIFYKLERHCPEHYYPKLHTSTFSIQMMRAVLLVLCVVQLAVAFAILYYTAVAHYLHDPFHELFTEAVAALCAFAACAGFVGVCASSRPMLLFLYINQLWSLSNVSTFAVVYLTSNTQSTAACGLYAKGELTSKQVDDMELDCEQVCVNTNKMKRGAVYTVHLLSPTLPLSFAHTHTHTGRGDGPPDDDGPLLHDRRVMVGLLPLQDVRRDVTGPRE